MPKPAIMPIEAVADNLRGLFESRGFRRTTPGKFEEYDLYVENRNFLDCEHLITFMDMEGRLLALKPDVTLSIIKNMPNGVMPTCEKLYYMDEVYRVSHETRDYKVLSQLGVELIGPDDSLSSIECIDLALEALAQIDPEYVLDLSHLGFVLGLFDSLELSHTLRTAVLSAVHAKSTHTLRDIIAEAALPEKSAAMLLELAELHGPFSKIMPRVRALCQNNAMLEACDELEQISAVVAGIGMSERVFLDFSVISDLDYYNGLLFLGYVKGVPKAILSGGRYDNLMRRMGKKSNAIGFAINLSDLKPYRKSGRTYDFDVLISYAKGCNPVRLLEEQRRFAADHTVRLEPDGSALCGGEISCKTHYRFTAENKLEEVAKC